MVGDHELDSLASQDPHPVELTAIQQHLGKPQIVPGRGRKPHAAERMARHVHVKVILACHPLDASAPVGSVGGRIAPSPLFRHAEDRVLHPQGLEDRPAAVLIECHSGEMLDQGGLHVMGIAVHPALTGLVQQRHARDLARQLVDGAELGVLDAGIAIGLIDRGIFEVPPEVKPAVCRKTS